MQRYQRLFQLGGERRCGPRGPVIAPVRPFPRRARGTPREEPAAIADGALGHADASACPGRRTVPGRRRAGLRRAGRPSACGCRRRGRTPPRRREMRGRPERHPEHLLVACLGGQRAGGGHDPGDHELAAFGGRGQEAVLLIREVGVEGDPGYPGPPHDVGDRDRQIAGFRYRRDHRPQQPFPLRRPHGLGSGRRLRPRGRPGFPSWVPASVPSCLGLGHGHTVTDVPLKYLFVLLMRERS